MNKVILSGVCVRNIETPNEKVGKFTLAVQRHIKDKDGFYGTDFLNCVVFNPNNYVKDRVKKGNRALVEGEIRINTYENNGNKRYSTDIIVNRVEVYTTEQKEPQKEENNPFEEFGEHFTTEWEAGQQIEISSDDLPF